MEIWENAEPTRHGGRRNEDAATSTDRIAQSECLSAGTVVAAAVSLPHQRIQQQRESRAPTRVNADAASVWPCCVGGLDEEEEARVRGRPLPNHSVSAATSANPSQFCARRLYHLKCGPGRESARREMMRAILSAVARSFRYGTGLVSWSRHP